MTDHPLHKRFRAMSPKGLEIMDRKLARAEHRQDDPEKLPGISLLAMRRVNMFWQLTCGINHIARY